MSTKISELIKEKKANNELFIALEFFPPKTEAGVKSLYNVMEKLKAVNPLYVDFTWGAGGSTSDLTVQLCIEAKEKFGFIPNMHLTCTNMEEEKITSALSLCQQHGIDNILALRGDPPAGEEKWVASSGQFTCALDLIRYIKSNYQNGFNITAAGYPEGHPAAMTTITSSIVDGVTTVTAVNPKGETIDVPELSPSEMMRAAVSVTDAGTITTVCLDADYRSELAYLKSKVDAGAEAIVTQLFFDIDVFSTFVKDCRDIGIEVPILPGIMLIGSRGGFQRMTTFCKTKIPSDLKEGLAACADDDAVKAYGIEYITNLCRALIGQGVEGLHFYTLNTSAATLAVVENLKNDNLLLLAAAALQNQQAAISVEA